MIWNWVDMFAYLLNIGFILSDLSHGTFENVMPLGSVVVFLMWMKLLYFLRLFLPTLYMIRMIVEVFYDIYAFTIVLALTIFAFGNSLYILADNALIAGNYTETPFDGENNYLVAQVYSYSIALGYNAAPYEGL